MHNWPDAVRALLDAHANVNARDRSGHTVLDFVDPDQTQLVQMLKASDAPPPSGRSARQVCDAERAFDKLGYQMPIMDCIDGTQFADTLRKFQKEHSRPATGELDQATLKKLVVRP